MRTNFNSTHSKRIAKLGHQSKCMITKTLGLALRQERERKKLTIEDLSKILNLNTKTILHVEDGTKKNHFLAMGIMLKFYKKKIELMLVDE
ncbi:MAG: helix-turn-helix domain-containing protein [Alphaproteobacteria bacterium]|nr:helix-turn-helix domain-containing protein [Alphaproteobacteria bacterium]